jgi:TPR repeat protein
MACTGSADLTATQAGALRVNVMAGDQKALKTLTAAAQKGNQPAQFVLGLMYENGDGVDQSYDQAAQWYRKAAEQQGTGALQAQNRQEALHSLETVQKKNSQGIPPDPRQAAQWYRKKAEQGDADAQCLLGALYDDGQGGAPQDYSEAEQWFRKAAQQGHAGAQCNLGAFYEHGRGVDQDGGQAAQWYRKAAEQGLASAQNNLGLLYENGQGVPKDNEQATQWFRKAAEQEYAPARYNLTRLLRLGSVEANPRGYHSPRYSPPVNRNPSGRALCGLPARNGRCAS